MQSGVATEGSPISKPTNSNFGRITQISPATFVIDSILILEYSGDDLITLLMVSDGLCPFAVPKIRISMENHPKSMDRRLIGSFGEKAGFTPKTGFPTKRTGYVELRYAHSKQRFS